MTTHDDIVLHLSHTLFLGYRPQKTTALSNIVMLTISVVSQLHCAMLNCCRISCKCAIVHKLCRLFSKLAEWNCHFLHFYSIFAKMAQAVVHMFVQVHRSHQ